MNQTVEKQHIRILGGRLYDNLPSDWGDMTPSPTYRAIPRGMDDPLTAKISSISADIAFKVPRALSFLGACLAKRPCLPAPGLDKCG